MLAFRGGVADWEVMKLITILAIFSNKASLLFKVAGGA